MCLMVHKQFESMFCIGLNHNYQIVVRNILYTYNKIKINGNEKTNV